MKTILFACLSTVTVLSMYLGHSFFSKKVSEESLSNVNVQQTSPQEIIKVDDVYKETEILNVDEKEKKLKNTSLTLKEKKRNKKKKNKASKQRQFKELLEDDIEFIEMT